MKNHSHLARGPFWTLLRRCGSVVASLLFGFITNAKQTQTEKLKLLPLRLRRMNADKTWTETFWRKRRSAWLSTGHKTRLSCSTERKILTEF